MADDRYQSFLGVGTNAAEAVGEFERALSRVPGILKAVEAQLGLGLGNPEQFALFGVQAGQALGRGISAGLASQQAVIAGQLRQIAAAARQAAQNTLAGLPAGPTQLQRLTSGAYSAYDARFRVERGGELGRGAYQITDQGALIGKARSLRDAAGQIDQVLAQQARVNQHLIEQSHRLEQAVGQQFGGTRGALIPAPNQQIATRAFLQQQADDDAKFRLNSEQTARERIRPAMQRVIEREAIAALPPGGGRGRGGGFPPPPPPPPPGSGGYFEPRQIGQRPYFERERLYAEATRGPGVFNDAAARSNFFGPGGAPQPPAAAQRNVGFLKKLFGLDKDEGLLNQLAVVGRYQLFYTAIIAAGGALANAAQEVIQFDDALSDLQVALQDTGVDANDLVVELADVAASAGQGVSAGLQAAARGIKSFRDEIKSGSTDAREVGRATEQVALRANVIANKFDPKSQTDVLTDIIAVTKDYNLGFDSQARVLDAATNAGERYAVSQTDLLNGMAQLSELAQQSGISIEELAAATAAVTARTGLGSGAAAGDLKRLFGGSGTQEVRKAFSEIGVNTLQPLNKQLEDAADRWKTLTTQQREAFVSAVGGRRSAQVLITYLSEYSEIQQVAAEATERGGRAAEIAGIKLNDLGGTLRRIAAEGKEALVGLFQSGILDGVAGLLTLAEPLVEFVSDLINGFNELPRPLRTTAFAIGEVTAALILLRRYNVIDLIAPLAQVVANLRGLGTGASANIAAGFSRKGVYPDAAFAANGAQLAIGGRATAGAARAGAGRLAALAPLGEAAAAIGPAVAIIAAVLAFEHGKQAVEKLAEASDATATAVRNLGDASTIDELQSVRNQAQAAEKQNEQARRGLFGGPIDFFRGLFGKLIPGSLRETTGVGLSAGEQAARAREIDELARRQQEALKAEQDRAAAVGDVSVFAPGPQSVDSLRSALEKLDAAGVPATRQLALLGQAITQAGTAADKPSLKVLKGTTEQFSLQQSQTQTKTILDTIYNTGFGPGAGPLDPTDQKTFNKFQIAGSPAGEKRRQAAQAALNKYIATLPKDAQGSAIIGDAEAAQIADLIIKTQLSGLIGDSPEARKFTATLRQNIINNLKAQARQPAITSQEAANFASQRAIDLAPQAGRIEALKSGGDQLVGTLTEVQALETKRAEIASLGYTTDALDLGIIEARRKYRDALQARLDGEAKLAQSQLPLDDEINRAKIDIIRLENQLGSLVAEGANPDEITAAQAELNDKRNQLAQLQIETANAAATSRVDPRSSLARARVELDNAQRTLAGLTPGTKAYYQTLGQLQQQQVEVARLEADQAAAHRRARIDPRDALRNAQADLAEAIAQRNLTQPGTLERDRAVRDVAEKRLAASRAGADRSNSARLARVYPGDPLAGAAAALNNARTNLSQELRGTVAWNDALRAYREARVAYTNAVVDASHNARLNLIDLTDPVAVAREELRTARSRLSVARRGGASKAVLDPLVGSVRQAENQAEAAAFQQRLSDAQTNFELGRTSHAAWLRYLNSEHERLVAIRHRTRQQQDELNQIDRLLKEAKEQTAGQFNIGDIKLPTIYEVRRSIKAAATGQGYQDNRIAYVQLSVNGGNPDEVRRTVLEAVRSDVHTEQSTQTTRPRKVGG